MAEVFQPQLFKIMSTDESIQNELVLFEPIGS